LSHRDAAALHALRPEGHRTRFEVTTPTHVRSKPQGLHVYARRSLDQADVTVIDAIPVTTVARTVVDLADVVPQHILARALATAERLRATAGPSTAIGSRSAAIEPRATTSSSTAGARCATRTTTW
jgi:predicted transcriptional regulator of viral defense system